ncbi:MAG: alpha/beta hydrolase fold [Gemmatimonadetes bacterium]|nr:alpha/beta hydrolase fold [Gemmatimonadota bacterium]
MSALRLTIGALVLLANSAAPALSQETTTGHFSTADQSRIYFEECGKGAAVVLLHDGVSGAAGWDAVWSGLCARYHVIRYDRRGMGRSDSLSVPFSSTGDLAALLANRHVSSATMVGASAGGGLAIDFALASPASVERIVLLGAVVSGLGYSDHFLQRERANAASVIGGESQAAAQRQANDRYMLAPGHDSAQKRLFDIVLANPQNLRKRGDLELPTPRPAVARLREISAPTLILVGEYDIPDVQAHAGAIELGIWGARREVVSDAGHLIQLDRPEFLTDRIREFIEDAPTTYVSAERLRTLAGSYSSPFTRNQTGKFYVQDGRLFAHFPGGRDIPLYPSSDSTFYTLARTRSQIVFRRDKQRQITAAEISVGGRVLRALPLSRR